MNSPPRALGRPLDDESARQRAAQAAVLADPLNLRVLSVVATAVEDTLAASDVADRIAVETDAVVSAVAALTSVGLLSPESSGLQLTADAWVRFGRLVAGTPPTAPTPPSTAMVASANDPVAERIARDLSYRFSSVFSPETVRKYVLESHALLAERAKITAFLPSLTARFAADRLSALATAKGIVLRGTPEVLFVCVQNAGRSQMASAILRHLAGDRVHVRTAGSSPAIAVHPAVIAALDEVGIPIAAEFPKPLTDEVVQAADYVITMGCGDACPVYPGRRYMDWELDDPVGLGVDDVRRVRDEIVRRIEGLLLEMGLTAR